MITAAVMQKSRYAISHDLLPTAREWQHSKLNDKTLLKVCNNWCFSVLYYYYLHPPLQSVHRFRWMQLSTGRWAGPALLWERTTTNCCCVVLWPLLMLAMPGEGVTGHDAMITRSEDQDISLSGRRAAQLPAASYRDGDWGWLGGIICCGPGHCSSWGNKSFHLSWSLDN